mgnify:CR=1 FL=1
MRGADLASRVHGGSAPTGLLDFSSPSNPLGQPSELIELIEECVRERAYASYPTRMYRELYESLSSYLGVSPQSILPLNGASEALQLTPLALKAKSIVVVEPNFGDHELLARGVGIKLQRFLLKEEGKRFTLDVDALISDIIKASKPSVLILSRPNNPTGRLASLNEIDDISSRIPPHVAFIVDEAFIDLSKAAPLPEREDLVVIRSLTKAFSTPGLRLGAVITSNRNILGRLEAAAQPWPVDSITACAFSRFLKTASAREHVRLGAQLAASELARLTAELRSTGITVYDSSAPFVLVRHDVRPNPGFVRELQRRGIYARDCSSFFGLGPSYTRLSVKLPEENSVLLNVIKEVVSVRD